MASEWFVSPEGLSRARNTQLMKQEELAKKSGVSSRSIGAYEREEQRVRLETLQCLAKALSTDVKDIAVLRTRGKGARPSPSDPPRPPAPPSALPARTQLETLVDLERAARVPAPRFDSSRGPVETLTAKLLQDVFTAYALYEGARFAIEARVEGMRGIPPAEAKLLGSRGGVAARFHLLKEVVPGKEIGVTVHSGDRAHTTKLQALYGETARVFVRVAVVPGEPSEDGPGFSSFITKVTSKRPWTFVVEEVTATKPAATSTTPAARKKSKRA
jgi:transcriptional regulator with XRE-family HTH domain